LVSKIDIQCPACNTTFKVDVAKIPEKGCHANCKKCKERFLISRPPAPARAPASAAAKKGPPAPAARPGKKTPPAASAPVAEATAGDSAPADEWTHTGSTAIEELAAAESDALDEWTHTGSTAIEELAADDSDALDGWTHTGNTVIEELVFDDSAPVEAETAASAGIDDWAVDDGAPGAEDALADNPPPAAETAADNPPPAAETAADNSPPAAASPANHKAAKKAGTPPAVKPGQGKKRNYLLIGGLAGLMLLVGVAAVYFLMQKFNLQITAKDSSQNSRTENTPDITVPVAVSQKPAAAAAENQNTAVAGKPESDIGDLFNQVNPAVATVLTYDSGNNMFMQGSGFFISRDGDFITNYHVLKGAYYVVIKLHNDIEYRAEFVLAANEQKDLIKLAVNLPDGELKPGTWLDINPTPPNIADKIIVVGTPMGLGRTVSDGIISAIREIPDRGLTFQMTAPISRGSSGSPVIDMDGKVVGVAFFQIVNGQNLNFAIPGDNIINLTDKRPQTIAEWTEEASREKNETLDNLQKEIVKHIKQEKADDKAGAGQPPPPTNAVLKTKLAAEILAESGIARQNNSLTEAVIASFEEKYEEVGPSEAAADDQKLSRFKDVIRLATNPDRINAYIKTHLAASLSIPELEQIVQWYKSPLGKKIAGMEYSTYAEKREQAEKLRLAFNLTRYQSSTRADLFARLDEATTSTEAMVELQTHLIVQNQILDMVLSNSKELDQASIDKIISNFKSDIDPYLDIFAAQLVFAGFVYTYRALSETELEAFLAFSETEAAKNYYSILNKKSNTVLLDCNRKILTSIVRVMNADSWDNIQQDLNQPIKES
jgi:predicted Zn finger-like uncharacterized protein